MQDYKRNAFMEADLRCSNAIQNMEKRLRAACHASDANVDNIVKVSIFLVVLLILHEVRGLKVWLLGILCLSVSHCRLLVICLSLLDASIFFFF